MKTRIAITALVLIGAIGLAGSALAETKTAGKKSDACMKLEHEFDAAKKEHVSATKLKHAKEQRTHGAALCSDGKTADGVKALKLALKDIGKN